MDETVIEVDKVCLLNEQLRIIMPLQKTKASHISAPTKNYLENTEQIHRNTIKPKCHLNNAA